MDADRSSVALHEEGLRALVDTLVERGREVWAPVVRDGVIAVARVSDVDQLPVGWRDEQSPGNYRLVPSSSPERFAWTVGPQTWKPLVHPPAEPTHVMTQAASDEPVRVEVRHSRSSPRALVGVRPCELAAIDRLTAVAERSGLGDDEREDRDDDFVVVVTCTHPADTCFCDSMATGPAVDLGRSGFDVTLTELVVGDGDDAEVHYLATAGSDAGRELLDELTPLGDGAPIATQPDDAFVAAIEAAHDAARSSMRRSVDTTHLHGALIARPDAPAWTEVGERCLACGNCTSVCPTCFCTALTDLTSVTQPGRVERWRTWDTCYSIEFSRLGPGPVRTSIPSRYRQWLTHKFDTWHDQFGSIGCVGCGRCITWCPVGIDVTEEIERVVAAPRVTSGAGTEHA